MAGLLLIATLSFGLASETARAYTPHVPISIIGDAEFTAVNGVTQGSGTPSDPYIIEGWEIAASSSSGIEVFNTRSYFVIRDVFVHSAPFGYTGVWLGNVSNGRVENSTASGNWGGFFAILSSDIVFARNNVSGNGDGIGASQSRNISFLYNNVSFNTGGGIGTASSSNNTIEGNTLIGNNQGLLAQWETDAVIRGNEVRANAEGIKLRLSSGVAVHHNALIGNGVQAQDDMGSQNVWDNGYPNGGNFWSDYAGSDVFSGPLQDQPGSDGIGDTPYVIDADSRDRYPLVDPGRIDWQPPEMFNATIDGNPHPSVLLSGLGPLMLRAVADDGRTGASNISFVNYTFGRGNWSSASPMFADDGAFDEVNETVRATILPVPVVGDYDYCTYATDSAWNENTTGICATLTIVDDMPPRIRNVTIDGQPSRTVVAGTSSVLLEAVVDDSTSGISVIGGANYTSPRGNWSSSKPMVPSDVLDSDIESFHAVVDAASLLPSTYELCVYGWDVALNRNSTGDCAMLIVIPPPPVRPDYVPTAAQPVSPIRVPLSSPISFSIQVHNQGNATATNDTTIAFYNETPPAPPFRFFTVTPMTPGSNSSKFTATWISPAIPGTYLVSVNVDYYDNIIEWNETNNVYTWNIDVVAGPITSLVIDNPNYTSAVAYVKSSTPLDFSVLDQSGTGIRYTNYSIDGGTWNNYTATATFYLSGGGEHTIDWFSEDNAGNVETVNSLTLRVDDTPPTTTFSVGMPNYTVGGNFVTSSTPITLQAVDGGTTPVGIQITKYRIDGGIWKDYSSPFTLAGEGAHRIEYYSIDLLMNQETAKPTQFIVDNTPPTTIHSIGDPKYLVGGNFVKSSTPLTLQAVDGGSTPVGVLVIKYRIDGGNWKDYSSSFTLAAEGTRTIEYYSRDMLTNEETANSTQVIVDDTPPATTLYPATGPYAIDTSFTLAATDSGSGVKVTRYGIDGSTPTDYSEGFTLPAGVHNISYYSTDQLDNTEAVRWREVTVQGVTQPPSSDVFSQYWWLIVIVVVVVIVFLLLLLMKRRKPKDEENEPPTGQQNPPPGEESPEDNQIEPPQTESDGGNR